MRFDPQRLSAQMNAAAKAASDWVRDASARMSLAVLGATKAAYKRTRDFCLSIWGLAIQTYGLVVGVLADLYLFIRLPLIPISLFAAGWWCSTSDYGLYGNVLYCLGVLVTLFLVIAFLFFLPTEPLKESEIAINICTFLAHVTLVAIAGFVLYMSYPSVERLARERWRHFSSLLSVGQQGDKASSVSKVKLILVGDNAVDSLSKLRIALREDGNSIDIALQGRSSRFAILEVKPTMKGRSASGEIVGEVSRTDLSGLRDSLSGFSSELDTLTRKMTVQSQDSFASVYGTAVRILLTEQSRIKRLEELKQNNEILSGVNFAVLIIFILVTIITWRSAKRRVAGH